MTTTGLDIAVVGGGWAGLSAAVTATKAGHRVTVYEAARHWGGRARSVKLRIQPDGVLDNGQHILIGAYTATLALMRQVGVDPTKVLVRVPLQMRYPDGAGWGMPAWAQHWTAPWDTLAAALTNRPWKWEERWRFLQMAARWQRAGFTCSPQTTVADLCLGMPEVVTRTLLEPLCVSALNTPPACASGQVFLRVLQDALFAPAQAPYKGSDLLVPQVPLGDLLPGPASTWLAQQGARLCEGQAVRALVPVGGRWSVLTAHGAQTFDHVVLACPVWTAARLVAGVQHAVDTPLAAHRWLQTATSLRHEDLATVYTQFATPPQWPVKGPMMALHSGPERPAQFVFDRGQLGGPPGLLAWVVSAPQTDRATVERQVLRQAQETLSGSSPVGVATVYEKRATFAATPGLERPGHRVAPGLWAAGDAVDGPYPATLEGAVRSGQAVVDGLG